MTSLLTCSEGGYLVGPSHVIPEDPSERAWPEASSVVGCNHLRCDRCGQPVAQRPGFGATPRLRQHLAEVRGAASWEPWVAASVLEADARVRLYVCACALHEEQAVSPVVDDPEGRPGGPPTWRCAGHPAPTARAPAADAPAIVAAAFDGETGGPEALDRRYNLADDPALREAIGAAVLAEAASSDARHRMRALGFFLRNPRAPQAARLVELYAARPELFDGVSDPFGRRPEVAAFLLEVLAARLDPKHGFPDAAGARDAIRAALLRGGPVPDLALAALASTDEGWLAEHAEDAVRAGPSDGLTERAGAVVHALRYLPDDAMASLVARVAAVPGVDRARLSEFLVDAIGGRTAELVKRTLAR